MFGFSIGNIYLDCGEHQTARLPAPHSWRCGSSSPCIQRNKPHLPLKMKILSHTFCPHQIKNCKLSRLPVNSAVGLSIHSLFWIHNTVHCIKVWNILWEKNIKMSWRFTREFESDFAKHSSTYTILRKMPHLISSMLLPPTQTSVWSRTQPF